MNKTPKPLVYVVEDSKSSGALYCSHLERAGYATQHYLDGHSALVAVKDTMPDVIIQDVCLPDISGLEVLRFVNTRDNPAPVVMVTSNSSIDVAVDAMRSGGFDFIEKPFTPERLTSAVADALKQHQVEIAEELAPVDVEPVAGTSFIGESLPMKTVFRLLESAARSKASVFITGESGTGKEVCAMTLHELGVRRNGPFKAINCAAIPHELFESEFFGHVKGAFSGALADRKGAVEVAGGGTLFLDEICEMDLNLQAKLLRFLQTGTFSRVGSSETLFSDVRVVCATNRNPAAEVGEGRFREDLFYRLNVIPVQLPALRDRGDDILLLANHVLREKSRANKKDFNQLAPEVASKFLNYEWPGNIRELQNVVENIVVIHKGTTVEEDMLPPGFGAATGSANGGKRAFGNSNALPNSPVKTVALTAGEIMPLWLVEKRAIEEAIEACDGNIPLAAAHLAISASTIYRKMKAWEQADPNFAAG